MSIFRRDSEPPVAPSRPISAGQRERPPAVANARTTLAAGTRVQGEVGGSTDLVVEGEIDGHIRLDAAVRIGETGVVEGEVEARSVVVAGTVRGDIHGHERVEVEASGKVEGNVVSPRVVISDGAFLKGRVEMAEVAPGLGSGAPGSGGQEPPRGRPASADTPGSPVDAAQAAGKGDER